MLTTQFRTGLYTLTPYFKSRPTHPTALGTASLERYISYSHRNVTPYTLKYSENSKIR